MNVKFLYDLPQNEIASLITRQIREANHFSAVVGFLTEEGIGLLADEIKLKPSVISSLVVGSCTLKACRGLDQLLGSGVDGQRLHLHLGFSRKSSPTAKSSFIQYHPMMHSKVYYFEKDGLSSAIIGSHNMTGFALSGQNGEASVLIEAASEHPIFKDIRAHIDKATEESVVYDSSMKLAYAWWYKEQITGLSYKILFGTGEEGVETNRTILAITVNSDPSQGLSTGDIVYLELPKYFQTLKTLDEPIHLYVLNKMPNTPYDALGLIQHTQTAYKAKVVGTNTQQVVQQGRTNWIVSDINHPILQKAAGTIHATPKPNDIQAFIEVGEKLVARYDYMFDGVSRWEPIFDETSETIIAEAHRTVFQHMKLIPPEHISWKRVRGLQASQGANNSSQEWTNALRETSPSSGKYVMFSSRRRLITDFR